MAGQFSERNAASVVYSILASIEYCHENCLYHGFLRPENILVDKDSEFQDIRIVNFPGSLTFNGNINLNEKFQFPHFFAPEMLANKMNPEEKSDCWSVGAIIFLLLSGKVPFEGSTD